ncbi:Helix-turn-helix domain protein [compost metagenome]
MTTPLPPKPASGEASLANKASRQLLTVAESAKILRLTPATVQKYVRTGLLMAIKIGRQYLIALSELERFITR